MKLLDAAVAAAIITAGVSLYTFFKQRRDEQRSLNIAIFAEIQRLLRVIAEHAEWWRARVRSDDTDFPLIPFATPVFDHHERDLGRVDAEAVGKVVQFYGFVKFLNSLQARRSRYENHGKAKAFDEQYRRNLDGGLARYRSSFDEALRRYGLVAAPAPAPDVEQRGVEQGGAERPRTGVERPRAGAERPSVPRSAVTLIAVALASAAAPADAQSLPGIPTADAINASIQIGSIWPAPYSTVPKTSAQDLDLWGFGVETEFVLPFKNPSWLGTLCVGYNQLNLGAELGAGRRLRGTLRDLPALSLYVGRAKTSGIYGGVTIAVSELTNGRLHSDAEPGMMPPSPIKISGSSFSAGAALGYETGPFFIELGYVGRYFPSLAYDNLPTSGFPADLGERMYAGGFVLRIGGTLTLKKLEPAKPEPAKPEPAKPTT